MRLGRRSISALIEYLEGHFTHAELDHLMFKHGLDKDLRGLPKKQRLGSVFYPLVEPGTDSERIRAAVGLFGEMAEDLWTQCEKGVDDACQWYVKLQGALRADGLDLVEGHLTIFPSPGVSVAQEQGLLETRLQKLGWLIPPKHWKQAIDNAAAGNWEAANSQVRSFLEGLCNEIAKFLYTGEGLAPTAGEARKYMVDRKFLNEEEAELLKVLFVILQRTGSHAGISDEADCHRRRMMALALANYYLDRLEGDVS